MKRKGLSLEDANVGLGGLPTKNKSFKKENLEDEDRRMRVEAKAFYAARTVLVLTRKHHQADLLSIPKGEARNVHQILGARTVPEMIPALESMARAARNLKESEHATMVTDLTSYGQPSLMPQDLSRQKVDPKRMRALRVRNRTQRWATGAIERKPRRVASPRGGHNRARGERKRRVKWDTWRRPTISRSGGSTFTRSEDTRTKPE